MRPLISLLAAAALFCLSLTAAVAQTAPLLALTAEPSTGATSATVLLLGRVEAPEGNVVGAVVSVAGNPRLKTVTNAAGDFQLLVPAGQPVSLTASYGGYHDVTAAVASGDTHPVLRLTVPQEIKVDRKQQLKVFMRHANHDIKREIRQMR